MSDRRVRCFKSTAIMIERITMLKEERPELYRSQFLNKTNRCRRSEEELLKRCFGNFKSLKLKQKTDKKYHGVVYKSNEELKIKKQTYCAQLSLKRINEKKCTHDFPLSKIIQ